MAPSSPTVVDRNDRSFSASASNTLPSNASNFTSAHTQSAGHQPVDGLHAQRGQDHANLLRLPPPAQQQFDRPYDTISRSSAGLALTDHTHSEYSDQPPPTEFASLSHGYNLGAPRAEMTALQYGYVLPQLSPTPSPLTQSPSSSYVRQFTPASDSSDNRAPLSSPSQSGHLSPALLSEENKASAGATYGHGPSSTHHTHADDAAAAATQASYEDHFGIFGEVMALPATSALELDSHFADDLTTTAQTDNAHPGWYGHDMFLGYPGASGNFDTTLRYLDSDISRKRSLEEQSGPSSATPFTVLRPFKKKSQLAHNIPHNANNCPDPSRCIHLAEQLWSDADLVRRGQRLPSDILPVNDSLHIPNFVANFFPEQIHRPSKLPLMQAIMDDCIHSWTPGGSISIKLNMHNFACPLRLQVHEFNPTNHNFNKGNAIYKKDLFSGKPLLGEQYTPPLGLKSIGDETRDAIETWMNDLLSPKFGFMMFEAYSEGHAAILNGTLDGLFKLFLDTRDAPLREMLKKSLKIFPLSYAKAHTLELDQSNVRSVLHKLRDPRRPSDDDLDLMAHISPKMAQRQVKVVITTMLIESMQWHLDVLQDVLDETSSAPPTTSLWLRAFCLLIILTTVLEKMAGLNHTMWYHQPKLSLGPTKFPVEHAKLHFEQDYTRMEATAKRLIAMFFDRFHTGVWSKTDFEVPGTGKLVDPASKRFVTRVMNLITTRRKFEIILALVN